MSEIKTRHLSLRILFVLAILYVLAFSTLRAQTSDGKAAEKKKFGSSLKHLKWDTKQKIAVEKEEKDSNNRSASESTDEAIELKTLLAVFDVLALDSHSRVIDGLNKNDFLISEDDTPQEVAQFAIGNDAKVPRSIILIIDYSGSLNPYFSLSIEAAKDFIKQLSPEDQVAIVTDDVELLCNFTKDRQQLNNALDKLHHRWKGGSRGKSFCFNALMATLKELVNSAETRTIIIFQSDGDQSLALRDQPTSAQQNYVRGFGTVEYGLADVAMAAEKAGATIYTVIPGDNLLEMPLEHLPEKGRLLRFAHTAAAYIAQVTGGRAIYLSDPDKAQQIYASILADINHRYVIGYYPTNTEMDGKRRKVKIAVRNHPEYTVVSRQGYYAAR